MTLERFAAEFDRWVRHYNTNRPHQGLGGLTPLQRWQQDATPIREIPAEELRYLLLAGEQRTIGKSGIRFAGLHYLAPELHGRVGQQVEVRYLPHDRRQIEVFHAGRWLCTAKPQDALTPEERDRVLARRRQDAVELARRQRRASRAARARLAPITEPGPVHDVSVVGRDRADDERRHGDDELRRLARTSLLPVGSAMVRLGQQLQHARLGALGPRDPDADQRDLARHVRPVSPTNQPGPRQRELHSLRVVAGCCEFAAGDVLEHGDFVSDWAEPAAAVHRLWWPR
jgi:hypothetical protein